VTNRQAATPLIILAYISFGSYKKPQHMGWAFFNNTKEPSPCVPLILIPRSNSLARNKIMRIGTCPRFSGHHPPCGKVTNRQAATLVKL